MPSYAMMCENVACRLHGQKLEQFMRAAERGAAKCCGCGRVLGTHPDQFGTIAVEREWSRGQGGIERTSLEVAFAGDADVASIKRDCPSMELKRSRGGMLRPVSRNDKHDKKWKKQFYTALKKYQDGGEA